jgi:PAS domain S-box-containing protein
MYNPDANYIDKPEIESLTTFGESTKVNFTTPSELYDAVYENAYHPMYMGSGDGHIFNFNKAFSAILGYSDQEMMGKKGFEIFEINEKIFLDFLKERNSKGIANAQITCIKKSGERFPCHISSVVYQTDQGKRRSLNTIIDISRIIGDREFLANLAAKDL